jgi:hypothetical protein
MSLGSIGGSQGFTPISNVGKVGGLPASLRPQPQANATPLPPMRHDTVSFAGTPPLGLDPPNRFGGLSPTTATTLQQNEAGLQAASQPQPGVVALAAGLGLPPDALGFNAVG